MGPTTVRHCGDATPLTAPSRVENTTRESNARTGNDNYDGVHKVGGGFCILLTGLPCSGKTSIARELEARFRSVGFRATVLDGDEFRATIAPELGFSAFDRGANLRRAAVVAAEIVTYTDIAICSFVAPYESVRMDFCETVTQHGPCFIVYVATPLKECERRDCKGMYRQARAGVLKNFTGVSDAYEPPRLCDFVVDTANLTVDEAAERVLQGLGRRGYISPVLWLALGRQTRTHSDYANNAQLADRRSDMGVLQELLACAVQRRMRMAEVALKVGIERHRIEAAVRAITGRSFKKLHQELLVERAQVLLREGRPIKQIAIDLGFRSQQAFHRFVVRNTGVPPTSLRH